MRRVSVFGSTGSIGVNTLDLIARRRAELQVVALTGHSNIELLAKQAIEAGAEVAVTADPARLGDLRDALSGSNVVAEAGPEAVLEAASRPTDWCMNAIVGAAGLQPGLTAARNTRMLALANKESLVCAGPLLHQVCAAHGTRLLPVDSEISALYQALRGEDPAHIDRLILTASGGPFRNWTTAQMANATPEQAVAHPMWDMGQRISIDSASMFNKAMEVIEAKEFFQVDPSQIEVLVHPQSIIHSLVGFRDGSLIAQVGPPDMRGAIGFALNYPERVPLPVERLDLASIAKLEFEAPDEARFPALALARRTCEIGGYAGAVFNAAKEAALDRFLANSIGFVQMADLVNDVLEVLGEKTSVVGDALQLDAILDIDAQARRIALNWQPDSATMKQEM
ncbi:1-deoxy-D-xylulose-5-phosphate reductoisomerase [Halovulum sp. GXIMD14793]